MLKVDSIHFPAPPSYSDRSQLAPTALDPLRCRPLVLNFPMVLANDLQLRIDGELSVKARA